MELEARVRAATWRIVALLDGADGSRPIPGMDWTVAEAAAHLVGGAGMYTGFFKGEPSPLANVDEAAEANAQRLAEYTERDPGRLSTELVAAVDRLLEAYRAGEPDRPLQWHADTVVSAEDTLGVIFGELVVHGWDMARGLGAPWPIDPADAEAVLTAALALVPQYVDAEQARAKGLEGTVVIKLRGRTAVPLVFKDGAVEVGRPGQPVASADCTISADPTAFLLSSYGRGSKWRPILTGKVVAYGRKPLLALKMQSVLKAP